jgi:drug/metabolite transporter (DMT)-like permease
MADRPAQATRLRLVLAFAALYVVWGSTYLAIKIAIETLPPFLMAGTRFLLAGALMYAWARIRGAARPTAANWRSAAVVGVLLLLGGNGSVVWAEQSVPSGVAALLVAMLPLWMVLIEALRPNGSRPTRQVVVGLALGLGGLLLLLGPGAVAGGGHVDPVGAAVLILASVWWASGSLYSRTAPLPGSPQLATGMQMLAGGLVLTLVGVGAGEAGRVDLAAASIRSVAALAYLVFFGSIVAFTAYIWLLRVTTPARVSTYAYVNPVVAVLLGWGLGGETVTPLMLVAGAVIVLSVVIITTSRGSAAGVASEPSRSDACDESLSGHRCAEAR